MPNILGSLLSRAIPQRVVPIAGQLSLDFSKTKHQFRKMNPLLVKSMSARVLFCASTNEYKDLLVVKVEHDSDVTEDSEMLIVEILKGLVLSEKDEHSDYKLEHSESFVSKKTKKPLGAIVRGRYASEGIPREEIILFIPTKLKFKNDSGLHISASYPVDSPKSLRDDLERIIRSTDVHTDN